MSRLFIGVWSTGVSYADRSRERHGDYARLAFLDFATLTLAVERDCPADLRDAIERDARGVQARRGERFATDACGHSVVLGGAS